MNNSTVNLLKRIASLVLDTVTVFGIAANILRLFATFLDAIQHAYDYPPKE